MSDRPVKCVVWDLDDTLWDGVLLEDGAAPLRPAVAGVLRTLDRRGILLSIASRGDAAAARERLRDLGIDDLFLHPHINWGSKVDSITEIARRLNLGLDAFAFVDDQPFELAEVASRLPAVRCFPASEAAGLPDLPEFQPRFVTDESRLRRSMYRSELAREEATERFGGSPEEFLASLSMVFAIAPATEADLMRAEELTVRTNQLNTTGRTYSYEELDEYRRSPRHLLLVAELEDRFGTYGKVGLTLIERGPDAWTIRLLLMSCRVLSRGVGTVLLDHVRRLAVEAGVALRADFVQTERNRMMFVTYRLAGFRQIQASGQELLLELAETAAPPPPRHLTLRTSPSPLAGEEAEGRRGGRSDPADQ